MLPIVLNETAISVGLAGAGEAYLRRFEMLTVSGISARRISPNSQNLQGVTVLFAAGLSPTESVHLANLAREQGVLVNIEDVPELCDFHVPATIRRGDLVLTVSTGGKSPGLARLLREWLEQKIGVEWSGRLSDVSRARAAWRAQRLQPSEVSQRTRDFVRDRNWLL